MKTVIVNNKKDAEWFLTMYKPLGLPLRVTTGRTDHTVPHITEPEFIEEKLNESLNKIYGNGELDPNQGIGFILVRDGIHWNYFIVREARK